MMHTYLGECVVSDCVGMDVKDSKRKKKMSSSEGKTNNKHACMEKKHLFSVFC